MCERNMNTDLKEKPNCNSHSVSVCYFLSVDLFIHIIYIYNRHWKKVFGSAVTFIFLAKAVNTISVAFLK